MVATTSCRNATTRRQWQQERSFTVTKAYLWTKENTNCSHFSSSGGKTLLTSSADIKERQTEHFTQPLSETSTVTESVINTLPQRPLDPNYSRGGKSNQPDQGQHKCRARWCTAIAVNWDWGKMRDVLLIFADFHLTFTIYQHNCYWRNKRGGYPLRQKCSAEIDVFWDQK